LEFYLPQPLRFLSFFLSFFSSPSLTCHCTALSPGIGREMLNPFAAVASTLSAACLFIARLGPAVVSLVCPAAVVVSVAAVVVAEVVAAAGLRLPLGGGVGGLALLPLSLLLLLLPPPATLPNDVTMGPTARAMLACNTCALPAAAASKVPADAGVALVLALALAVALDGCGRGATLGSLNWLSASISSMKGESWNPARSALTEERSRKFSWSPCG